MAAAKQWSANWDDYQLLDAGGGQKLERIGGQVLWRPDVNAYFPAKWSAARWQELADWRFIEHSKSKGEWQAINGRETDNWQACIYGVAAQLNRTPFKHIGLFPEQQSNWQALREHLSAYAPDTARTLNLFAYTGVASLVARAAGSRVVHVDAVKQLIGWAKDNMAASQLSDVQWVLDDALKFAAREVKREKKYDAIIMDPPAFGLGAKGEKWILEQKLPLLLQAGSDLLAKSGLLIVNTYSPKISVEQLSELAAEYFPADKRLVRELWIKAESGVELYYGNVLQVRR